MGRWSFPRAVEGFRCRVPGPRRAGRRPRCLIRVLRRVVGVSEEPSKDSVAASQDSDEPADDLNASSGSPMKRRSIATGLRSTLLLRSGSRWALRRLRRLIEVWDQALKFLPGPSKDSLPASQASQGPPSASIPQPSPGMRRWSTPISRRCTRARVPLGSRMKVCWSDPTARFG